MTRRTRDGVQIAHGRGASRSCSTATAAALDRRFGWDRLPRPLGVLTLVGLRTRLREQNLYDTGARPRRSTRRPSGIATHVRSPDGSHNDLAAPAMGMIGARFGRNVPLEHTYPEPAGRSCSSRARGWSAASC